MDGTAKVIVLGVLAAMLAGCATLMIDGVLLERGVWAVDAAYGTTNLFLSAVPATLELSGADIVVTFRTDLGTLRLRYLDETIDGDRARVGLLILTRRDVNIPVEVRLVHRDERWLVWDVVLDGISVVGNYRAQFDRIMRRGSYATLVAHLRAKTAELSARVKPGDEEDGGPRYGPPNVRSARDEPGRSSIPQPPKRSGRPGQAGAPLDTPTGS